VPPATTPPANRHPPTSTSTYTPAPTNRHPQVAYKTPWTAISSLLGQLAADHGPRSLLALNLCYFLPPMPLLWLMGVTQVRA
jgi:hypothetical protein